jgi:hypothetical protein
VQAGPLMQFLAQAIDQRLHGHADRADPVGQAAARQFETGAAAPASATSTAATAQTPAAGSRRSGSTSADSPRCTAASAHAITKATPLNIASRHSAVWNGNQGRLDSVTAEGGLGGRLPKRRNERASKERRANR